MAQTRCRHTEVNSIKGKKIESCSIPVSRTVHGLQGELLLFHLKGEHVLAVVLPVPRGHPQAAIEDVGSHDFLESSSPVFALLEQNTHIRGSQCSPWWREEITSEQFNTMERNLRHVYRDSEVPPAGGVPKLRNTTTLAWLAGQERRTCVTGHW